MPLPLPKTLLRCGILVLSAWVSCGFVAGADPAKAVSASADSTVRRPNLLVVLSDDHSVPHLGCYGNAEIRTPNLDRLAAQGMRFDRAYTAAPQCVPSRAALMAGRSPVGIGMTRFSAEFPAEVVAYPDLLKAAGYFVGLAGRTYHLEGGNTPEMNPIFEKHGLRTFGKRFDFAKTAGSGSVAVEQFKEFLTAVPAGKPFFLQLCFSDPHRPLDSDAIPQPHDPRKLTLPKHFPDTPAVRADFAAYYDEISRLDRYFGQVDAELERRGLTENTLVVFMGDNGCSQWRGKGTLYEYGLNVPLLVRFPGRAKAGSTSAALISGEDIAPTLLAAAGLPPAKGMTGRSFLPLLAGEAYTDREFVFAERGAHGSGLPGNSASFDLGRCVISKSHKFIYNATPHLPYKGVDFGDSKMFEEVRTLAREGKLPAEIAALYKGEARPLIEVYDLKNDPAELHNLAGNPEIVAVERELRLALIEWMILERDHLPLPISQPRPAKAKRND